MTRRAASGAACCAAAPAEWAGMGRTPPSSGAGGGGGWAALVFVNKIRLVDQDAVENAVVPYRLADVPVLLTSALCGDGTEDLRREIAGRLVAFIGPSRAGKSSLLNALDPALNLRVGALNVAGKGAHTTTWAATYRVADGLVVDTPGPREIGFLQNEGAGG